MEGQEPGLLPWAGAESPPNHGAQKRHPCRLSRTRTIEERSPDPIIFLRSLDLSGLPLRIVRGASACWHSVCFTEGDMEEKHHEQHEEDRNCRTCYPRNRGAKRWTSQCAMTSRWVPSLRRLPPRLSPPLRAQIRPPSRIRRALLRATCLLRAELLRSPEGLHQPVRRAGDQTSPRVLLSGGQEDRMPITSDAQQRYAALLGVVPENKFYQHQRVRQRGSIAMVKHVRLGSSRHILSNICGLLCAASRTSIKLFNSCSGSVDVICSR
jgi:hypothetical protein